MSSPPIARKAASGAAEREQARSFEEIVRSLTNDQLTELIERLYEAGLIPPEPLPPVRTCDRQVTVCR